MTIIDATKEGKTGPLAHLHTFSVCWLSLNVFSQCENSQTTTTKHTVYGHLAGLCVYVCVDCVFLTCHELF